MKKLSFRVDTELSDNKINVCVNERSFAEDEYTHVVYRLYKDGKAYKNFKLDRLQDCYVFLLNEDGIYFVRVSIYNGGGIFEFNSVNYAFFSKTEEQFQKFLNDDSPVNYECCNYYPLKGMYSDYLLVVNADCSGLEFSHLNRFRLSKKISSFGYFYTSYSSFDDVFFSGQATVENKPSIFRNDKTNSKYEYVSGKTELKEIRRVKNQLVDATGCFTLVCNNKDKFTVRTDYFGLSSIYYYKTSKSGVFIASNRYYLLLKAMSGLGIKTDIDIDYAAAHLYIHDLPAAQNMTEELMALNTYVLRHDKYIEISDNKVEFKDTSFVENYIEQEYDEDEYKKLVKKAAYEIQNNYNAVFESNQYDCFTQDLTGGMDSRVVFACAVNCKDADKKVSIRTYGDINEKRISYTMANHFGFSVGESGNKIQSAFTTLNAMKPDEHLDYMLSNYIGTEFDHACFFELHDIYDEKCVRMTGMAGEICSRPYIAGGLLEVSDLNESFSDVIEKKIRKMAHASFLGYQNFGESYKRRLCSVFDKAPFRNKKNNYEWLLFEYRNRVHFSLTFPSGNIIDTWTPWLSKSSYKACQMSIANHNFRKYIYDLIYELNPKVATFEYLEERNNNDRLQHTEELICRDESCKNKLVPCNDTVPERIDRVPMKIYYNPSNGWKKKPIEYVYERFLADFKALMLRSAELKKLIGVPLYHFLAEYKPGEIKRMDNCMIGLYKKISSMNEILNIFNQK